MVTIPGYLEKGSTGPGGSKPVLKLRRMEERPGDATPPPAPENARAIPPQLAERSSRLISDAAEGDREALGVLLSAARPQVYAWALKRTGGSDDAEDITQRVLLRMYEALSTFRGDSKLSSWLYRITAHEATGHHRRKSCRTGLARRWKEEAGTRNPSTPWEEREAMEDRLDWARMARAVGELARTLPHNQMTVFRLVDLEGMEPCEASRRLGKKLATTRSTLCRARGKMRRLLLEAEGDLAEELLPGTALFLGVIRDPRAG